MSSKRSVALVLCVGFVVAAFGTALAQQRDAELGTMRISLRECLEAALDHNLDIVSQSYVPAQSQQDIATSAAPFDPSFFANFRRSDSKQEALQLSSLTDLEVSRVDVGANTLTKIGAQVNVSYNMFESLRDGPNVIAAENWQAGFQIDLTLPILKNFGKRTNTEQIVLARNNVEMSWADLEVRAETTLQSVENKYWDVLAARRALELAQLRLKRAQDLLELNRKKVEVGTMAQIEITQAEAGVASNEEGVILAEQTLEDEEDALLQLMAIPEFDPRWNYKIEPTDSPSFERVETDLDKSIDTALQNRSELYRSRQAVRNAELSERVAKRQKRHQLDFVAGYGPFGRSPNTMEIAPSIPGPMNPNPTPVPPGDSGDSFSRIFGGDQYNWNWSLQYTLPISNRAAKADFARKTLARGKSEVDLQNQEQTIRVEVRRAVRAVDSGIKRVEAADKNVELQAEKLRAEEKKFENGMSTSFEVLTFQNDLADAELKTVQAKLDYVKALAELERAQGTLLESRGMMLERDVPTPDSSRADFNP